MAVSKTSDSEHEAREYAESIINTIREPLIVLDHDLKVVTASRSFYDVFKVSPEETEGQLIYDLGHKQWNIPELRELLEVILPEKNPFDDYEVQAEFPDIGRRTMLHNAREIRRKSGKERLILLAIEDITEHKRLENLLSASEERYRHLFENANDAILLLEKHDGRIAETNPAARTMLGYGKEELVGKALNNVGFPDDIGGIREILQTLERDGIFHYKDAPVQTKTGQVIDTDIYMVDRSDLVQCNIRDITERRQAEEKYRTLFESSSDAIFLMQQGQFIDCNAKALEIFRCTRDQILGKSPLIFSPEIQPDGRYSQEKATEKLDLCLQGEPQCFEWRQLRYDGEPFEMEISLNSVQLGQEIFIQGIGRDITARKRAEQDRIERKAAEAASRQKSIFISNMSHEIRTPMNVILGFAQILERDPSLNSKQKEQLRSINRSGGHLLNLINDVLDMSKIEAGMSVLKPSVFCLHDLLDDLEMMFRSRTDAKGLQLVMERDESVPSHVRGDEGKLRQVFVNLMGNAIKFTETGGVAVRVRTASAEARPEGDDQSLDLVVEIEDSGPGFPKEDMDRIFTAFRQGKVSDKAGGTGLGLSLSQRLVEMMGGKLTAESQEGKGSCFRFEVELELAEGLTETKETQPRQVVGLETGTGPWRILVVDDVQSNRDVLRDHLQPLGVEVREAENGAKALDIFQEWSPHTVLMDMRMPVMDGYEATRRIKATEAGRATPVIAITASALKGAEEEGLPTEIFASLRKPFRTEELYEVLGKCLGLEYVYADAQGQTSTHPKPPPLTPESLAALPRDLVYAMRQAVAEGDTAHLAELIGQVKALDSEAAHGLHALADRYDYAKLEELLGKSGDAYE